MGCDGGGWAQSDGRFQLRGARGATQSARGAERGRARRAETFGRSERVRQGARRGVTLWAERPLLTAGADAYSYCSRPFPCAASA